MRIMKLPFQFNSFYFQRSSDSIKGIDSPEQFVLVFWFVVCTVCWDVTNRRYTMFRNHLSNGINLTRTQKDWMCVQIGDTRNERHDKANECEAKRERQQQQKKEWTTKHMFPWQYYRIIVHCCSCIRCHRWYCNFRSTKCHY